MFFRNTYGGWFIILLRGGKDVINSTIEKKGGKADDDVRIGGEKVAHLTMAIILPMYVLCP